MYRFADNHFNAAHITTIGVDFRTLAINVNGIEVDCQIWDTAGQERFLKAAGMASANTDAMLLVIDAQDGNLNEQIHQLAKDSNAVRVVLINKMDMVSQEQMDKIKGDISARIFPPETNNNDQNYGAHPVSALSGQNVQEVIFLCGFGTAKRLSYCTSISKL